jgi:DNA-binding transcriptional LysR family regulator
MLASEMAKAGLGVALVPDFLARRDVEDGRLAYFDKTRMPSGRTYNLCFKQRRAQEQGIQVLAKWFRTQIEPSPKARLFKIGAAR